MNASSQSEKSKISILVNELNRRLAMIDTEVEEEERVEIVDHFCKQLQNSGYSRDQIIEIVLSSLKGRKKKEEEIKNRGRNRFQSAAETLNERTRRKLLEAHSWYKDKIIEEERRDEESFSEDKEKSTFYTTTGNLRKGSELKKKNKEKLKELVDAGIENTEKGSKFEEKIKGVIFVKHTAHSTLAKRIREGLKLLEKVGSFKIKIVERTGDTLVDLLHRSNAWKNEDCKRKDCIVCSSTEYGSKLGSCRQKNVTYETFCITCE